MTNQYDITLVTQAEYVQVDNPNDYVRNILLEDKLLMTALQSMGLSVKRLSWDDPYFDWSKTNCVLIRATWDYVQRIQQFREWLQVTSRVTQFINPYPLLIWNMDKHYLETLSNQGVAIAPTRFLKKGEIHTLSSLFAETGFDEVVIKPVIGGGGYHTYRMRADQVGNYQQLFSQLIQHESFLFQQFQPSVLSFGEISLMFFGGQFSHAIRKQAKEGEFRVQDDFGGTVMAFQPDETAISTAQNILSLCKPKPHYARVDLISDGKDGWYLSELELIEPELWFRFDSNAALLLAEHLNSIISGVMA